jgi:transposase
MQHDSVCWGVAPALLPTKPGDRVTTDRRDARPLARLMRAGALPPVYGPAVDAAASRALSRARDETLRALQAATWRRNACLLRPDSRSTGRAHGSPAHLRWLRAGVCPTPAQPMGLQADVQTVTAQPARLQRLAPARRAQGHTWRVPPVAEALQALRGVQCTVAVPPVAARGARTRVHTPRPRMHSLGVTPSDSASGPRRQPGSLTTPGNTQARRALVAGAGASRSPAQGSRHLPQRLATLPAALQAISGQAQGRLCTRDRPVMAKGTHAPQGVVAMARACRACRWAMAQQVVGPPHASR